MLVPRKRLAAVISTAVAALLLLPATGQAATIFGSQLNHDPTHADCLALGPCTIVSYIHPSAPNGDPYSEGAPTSGVITSFSLRAIATTATQVTLRLAEVTPAAGGNSATATAVATGPTVTFQPNGNEASTQQFSARVSVKKGQHLALDASGNFEATYQSGGEKFSYVFAPPLVDNQAPRTSTEVTGQLLIQATIEPDADGDGYGDETQDQCPSQASTHGPCDTTPPAVTGFGVSNGKVGYQLSEAATVSFALERKKPGRKVGGKCVAQTRKNRAHRHCAKFRQVGSFSGPGNAGANQLALPNGKGLAPGTYRLTMTAVDVAGNTTVQSATFTIKPPRKKHH